jgi:MFS family permease
MSESRLKKPFYGYFIVAACFINLFMLWGMFVNSFGIFFKPIVEEMGWSRGMLSGALSIRSIGMALMAPVAGTLIDRFGAKPIMAAGVSVVGAGLIAAGFITSLWQLNVIFFFTGCGLAASTMIPASLILSNWFVSRRGTAMSLAFVGTGVGGAILSPAANWVIINYSWRTAFWLCGATILLIVVPVILLVIKDRPSEMGLEPYISPDDAANGVADEWGATAKQALRTPAFWLIAAVMFIVALIANGVHNHCVPYLTDIGHERTVAAYVWGVAMGVLVIGKLAFGPIADRWGAKKAMAGVFCIFALSMLVLIFAKTYWLALAFACLYGFACGGPLTLYALLTVDNLGIKNFGSIYGNLVIAGAIGSAFGPVVPGVVFDRFGTYLPILGVFIVVALLGVICSLAIKPFSPEMHE